MKSVGAPISTPPKTRGFTIVELLVVIVVIAILAAITIVSYNGIQARARTSRAETQAQTILSKLELFRINVGTLPLGGSQGWDVQNDLSSTYSETQLPSSLVVVRGANNTDDTDVTDYATVSPWSEDDPVQYVFFVCTDSDGNEIGEKVAYPDFTSKTVKFLHTTDCPAIVP